MIFDGAGKVSRNLNFIQRSRQVVEGFKLWRLICLFQKGHSGFRLEEGLERQKPNSILKETIIIAWGRGKELALVMLKVIGQKSLNLGLESVGIEGFI